MILEIYWGANDEDNLSIPANSDLLTGSGKFIQFASINPNLIIDKLIPLKKKVDHVLTNP
jgi:hypothetical protein